MALRNHTILPLKKFNQVTARYTGQTQSHGPKLKVLVPPASPHTHTRSGSLEGKLRWHSQRSCRTASGVRWRRGSGPGDSEEEGDDVAPGGNCVEYRYLEPSEPPARWSCDTQCSASPCSMSSLAGFGARAARTPRAPTGSTPVAGACQCAVRPPQFR
jgi:hypothetical protein